MHVDVFACVQTYVYVGVCLFMCMYANVCKCACFVCMYLYVSVRTYLLCAMCVCMHVYHYVNVYMHVHLLTIEPLPSNVDQHSCADAIYVRINLQLMACRRCVCLSSKVLSPRAGASLKLLESMSDWTSGDFRTTAWGPSLTYPSDCGFDI